MKKLLVGFLRCSILFTLILRSGRTTFSAPSMPFDCIRFYFLSESTVQIKEQNNMSGTTLDLFWANNESFKIRGKKRFGFSSSENSV